jgi:hypothetical protein
VCIAAAGWGAAIALVGWRTPLAALVFLAWPGRLTTSARILRGNILLTVTPDTMRGRLSGIELAQVAGAPEIGNVEAGIVASLASVRASIVSGGVLASPATAVCALVFRLYVRYDAGTARDEAAPAFFARSVHEVAPELVGATLLVDGVGGQIVEVEAYDHEDPRRTASRPHRAQRVDVRPARARVRLPLVRHPLVPELRVRGGSAVLIAALEPTHGLERWPHAAAPTSRGSSQRAGPAHAGARRSRASTTACRSTVRPSSSTRRRHESRSEHRIRASAPWRTRSGCVLSALRRMRPV